MNYLLKHRGIQDEWLVDSAGTRYKSLGFEIVSTATNPIDYHIGDRPDERTIDVCQRRLGSECPPITHRARQLAASDFNKFQYILYMDTSNGKNINHMKPKGKFSAKVQMIGEYDPEKVRDEPTVVEDPYYDSNLDGFEFNYDLITRCLNHLLDEIYL